ncbi:MAG: hypothetical protein IPJ65_00595 [Archangiaceae bacterium]|nr:hypothetical protein [Archangiaceae bacterium]
MLSLCTVLAACDGSSGLLDLTATTEAALTTAQCNYGDANGCFDTFNTCVAAEGADLAACNTALHACLPPPPSRGDGGMPGGCNGGGGRPGHGGPGGPGGHDGGPPGPHDHHGGAPGLTRACHDALEACLAAAPADPRTCFDTEHQCVKDELAADFAARCDDALAECASVTSDACTAVTQRCADGVGAMPATCE